MAEPLAVRYRPTAFDQMVGQNLTAVVLDQMVKTAKVPSGLLFVGPSGTGKTTAARILAAGLNPGADLALAVVEIDAASNGGVADMRALTESLRYSTGSAYRVVILDEAHSLTRDAFNALLKTLEEPPPGTVFVLVTTEPHKIPETVASRLMEFEFRRVAPAEILYRLLMISTEEAMDLSPDLLQHLAQTCEGSVRRAVMDLEKAHLAGLKTLDAWHAAVSVKDIAPTILDPLSQGDVSGAFAALDTALSSVGQPSVVTEQMTRCLRDMLVLRSGGSVVSSGHGLETRQALAVRLEADRVLAAIKILWDLRTKIKPAEDPRGSLDLAVALIGEVFMRGKNAPAPSPGTMPTAPRPEGPPPVEMPVVPAPEGPPPVQMPTVSAPEPEQAPEPMVRETTRKLSLADLNL